MIPFIDLAAQQALIRPELDAAIARVLDHGKYIMGPEVQAFEAALSAHCGAKHTLSCSNGTDALVLALMALEAGPGDAVICPSFTFAATAEAVALVGATPVFADVEMATFNLDPHELEVAAECAANTGLTLRGILPVDLFGLSADYKAINQFASDNGLWVIADAAQSYGGSYQGEMVGVHGDITTTSFFPAKPLGCYGDGGAVFTQDDALASRMESIRVHGKGTDKYDNIRIGLNARLDTLQAAILIEKLKLLPREIQARQAIAERYSAALAEAVTVPQVPLATVSAWAQYTVLLPEGANRNEIQAELAGAGVPSAIYYPAPLHEQSAYKRFPVAGELPTTATLTPRVLSLPMHPYLKPDVQDKIIAACLSAFR